jgi:hypothetical protein
MLRLSARFFACPEEHRNSDEDEKNASANAYV